MFHGDRYLRPRMNYGNPYSSGNQFPINPHKWKENGFICNNKGWFRKAKHPTSEFPRNWQPSPKSSIPSTTIERGNPHSETNLVPLKAHGNFQMQNECFRKDNSRADHARAQWGKDININILQNDFFMIEFMSNEEKWQAKNKGPYILDGIEVHIIDWQPNFNPRTHVIPDSKVWIIFYNCPSDYWHIDVIKDICKNLGTFVSVDDILEDKIWGRFLRIYISTDQITKILDEVKFIGAGKIWIQKIDRED
ncbi:hypothetical protein SUGI_0744380 [Cryptomeria japonica]|nr:hypothetical protein SUGI_0744380 [Cryptomeria japonica]